MNFFIGAFYDGAYLLGMVLNETLTEHGDIRDGLTMTKKMWNRDFHGKRLVIAVYAIIKWPLKCMISFPLIRHYRPCPY